MPVTRSEILFLCGGALAGVVAAKNYDQIKSKVTPWVSGVGDTFGDAYSAAARKAGERVESLQDALAEMRHNRSQPHESKVGANGA